MSDPKNTAPGFAMLPADLQQSLAGATITQLGLWLGTHLGGPIIVAAQLPGVIGDNGKPTVVLLVNGYEGAESMLPEVENGVRHMAEQWRAAQRAEAEARKEN